MNPTLALTHLVLRLPRFAVGDLDPSPEEGRCAAAEELSKPEYQERTSVIQRIREWFAEIGRPNAPDPEFHETDPIVRLLLQLALVALVLAVVGLVVYAIARMQHDAPAGGDGGVFDEEELLPPQQYRERARAALAAGDFDAALLDAFRALTSRSAERTLLDEVPSLTARAVGRALRAAFPGHAEPINALAGTFDEVRYGSGHATQEQARAALDLEQTIDRTRPVLDGADPWHEVPLVAPGSSVDPEEAR